MICLTALISSVIFLLHLTSAGYNVNGGVLSLNDIFVEDFDGDLKYQPCQGLQPSIILDYLDPEPKQFTVPQNLSLTIGYRFLRNLVPPITVSVTIWRKLFFLGYVKIPCIAHFGSCTFSDVCEILETYPPDSTLYRAVCPSWLKITGLKCKCPFEKGEYQTHNSTIALDESRIPKWISVGDYRMTFSVSDDKGTAGCFKFQFRVNN